MLILSSPLYVLGALWKHRIDLFWPIWIAITGVSATLVLWVIPKRNDAPKDAIQRRPNVWSVSAIVTAVFLMLFLVLYIAGDLVWQDFTYYDNSLFTMGTLAGHNIPAFIWPSEGRFFPLCDQEYNLLRHLTHSVAGYFALRFAQIVLIALMLLFLDKELSVTKRTALVLLLLVTPSIFISFSGLIYPESNLVFSLLCFAVCIERFEWTHHRAWAVCAMISAQFMLYYKETVFLLILGFAGGRLLLRCKLPERKGWDWKRLRDPESRLDACLALLVVPFLLYYFAAMFPSYRTRYAQKFHLPFLEMVETYLKVDLLAWVLVGYIFARAYQILRRNARPSLLWDGLALGAVAYMAGYLALGMQSAYYFAPADLIAVLYVGRITVLAWQHLHISGKSFAVTLLAFVFIQDLSLSAFRMYEMKNVIHAKSEMGSMIEEHYQDSSQSVQRIFFPFTPATHMMEFGAYLSYRGVPMERENSGMANSGTVTMVGRAVKKDGPCVSGKPLICHTDAAPNPGDLVVVLPDDFAQTDELNLYKQVGKQPLFSYDPYPSIPNPLKSFAYPLRVISPEFFHGPLPDGFLHASVTVWE